MTTHQCRHRCANGHHRPAFDRRPNDDEDAAEDTHSTGLRRRCRHRHAHGQTTTTRTMKTHATTRHARASDDSKRIIFCFWVAMGTPTLDCSKVRTHPSISEHKRLPLDHHELDHREAVDLSRLLRDDELAGRRQKHLVLHGEEGEVAEQLPLGARDLDDHAVRGVRPCELLRGVPTGRR